MADYQVIEVDGEEIEFPSTMSDADIVAAVKKIRAQKTPAPSYTPPEVEAQTATVPADVTGGRTGNVLTPDLTPAEQRQSVATGIKGFGKGVLKSLEPVGKAAVAEATQPAIGRPDTWERQKQAVAAVKAPAPTEEQEASGMPELGERAADVAQMALPVPPVVGIAAKGIKGMARAADVVTTGNRYGTGVLAVKVAKGTKTPTNSLVSNIAKSSGEPKAAIKQDLTRTQLAPDLKAPKTIKDVHANLDKSWGILSETAGLVKKPVDIGPALTKASGATAKQAASRVGTKPATKAINEINTFVEDRGGKLSAREALDLDRALWARSAKARAKASTDLTEEDTYLVSVSDAVHDVVKKRFPQVDAFKATETRLINYAEKPSELERAMSTPMGRFVKRWWPYAAAGSGIYGIARGAEAVLTGGKK